MQDTKEVTQLVKRIASMNKPTIPEYRFKGFQNGQEIDTYLFEHPNTVLAAIEIFKESNTSYAFSVQVNSTARWFKGKFQEPTAYIALPVQMAVERAIATEVAGENIDWHVNIAEYPHPAVQVGVVLIHFLCVLCFWMLCVTIPPPTNFYCSGTAYEVTICTSLLYGKHDFPVRAASIRTCRRA